MRSVTKFLAGSWSEMRSQLGPLRWRRFLTRRKRSGIAWAIRSSG